MDVLKSLCETYLRELRDQRAQSNSTDELSYRDYLGKFLRGVRDALGKPADFTGEAKMNTFGRPDYEVTSGLRVIGYIEAEALGTPLKSLKGHAKEQNERFRANLHNFLLTNHTEFRLYIDGKEVEGSPVLLPEPPEHGAVHVGQDALTALSALFTRFLDEATPSAATPEAVARQLAHRARALRLAAGEMLAYAESPLRSIYNAYQQAMYADLSDETFADLYAQTFTYGLFLAWFNTHTDSNHPFTQDAALKALPRVVPPIRVMLTFGGGTQLPEEFAWIVNGICSDLNAAVKESILKPYKDGRDPIFHFYETFLAAYDPALREQRGVYYTPDQVVEFIVRAVDDLLRDPDTFDKPQGLADASVTLLDPAVGTGTFLAHAYKHVYDTMFADFQGGVWPDRARNHVAKHFYGIELMPAAYTLAHVKLRQILAGMDVKLPDTQRLPIYLANTLEETVVAQQNFPLMDVLSAESVEAGRIKKDASILVVMGNPPYSGHSANSSKDADGKPNFIGKLVHDYYFVDGEKLGEKNPKWLQDDYVKFLRFAEHLVSQRGDGIVGFITNHGYLDNPTFRGMRRHLMRTFDAIYIYDLHGNSKKKERTPEGGDDKNVFDIQQGVAICLLVKHPYLAQQADSHNAAKGVEKGIARVFHADLYGLRQQKYTVLQSSALTDVDWKELTPNAPAYRFKQQDQSLRAEYEQGSWMITDVFPSNAVGFQTHRDYLVLDPSRDILLSRMKSFVDASKTDDEIRTRFFGHLPQGRYLIGDTADFNLTTSRNELSAVPSLESWLTPCIRKPFDFQWYFYHPTMVDRGRYSIQNQLIHHKNIALLWTRPMAPTYEFSVLCASCAVDQSAVGNKMAGAGGTYVAPLYIYPDATATQITTEIERKSNLNEAFLAELMARISNMPSPEDVFHYAYAVFHAPTYRTRYAEFLKIDFPRLPLPPDAETFHTLAALGAKLVALHLLEAPSLNRHGIGYPVAGNHHVVKMRPTDRYHREDKETRRQGEEETGEEAQSSIGNRQSAIENPLTGRVRLNATEYFENVPQSAWEFRVGGYQPAAKWLDDRADRVLTEADITHYQRMIAALRDTALLLPDVDAAFLRCIPEE